MKKIGEWIMDHLLLVVFIAFIVLTYVGTKAVGESGGARGMIIDAGKEVKYIIEEIMKEE